METVNQYYAHVIEMMEIRIDNYVMNQNKLLYRSDSKPGACPDSCKIAVICNVSDDFPSRFLLHCNGVIDHSCSKGPRLKRTVLGIYSKWSDNSQ